LRPESVFGVGLAFPGHLMHVLSFIKAAGLMINEEAESGRSEKTAPSWKKH